MNQFVRKSFAFVQDDGAWAQTISSGRNQRERFALDITSPGQSRKL
jgi:hypothetical protein